MMTQAHNAIITCRFEHIEAETGLIHMITTRKGGVSDTPYNSLNLGLTTGDRYINIGRNQELLSGTFDLPFNRLTSSRQVHGSSIACISAPPAGGASHTIWYTHCGFDGLSTQRAGIPLMIRVADCVPILLYDPHNKAVAVVHAGWRGTLDRIAHKAVEHMRIMYRSRASTLQAGIGPAIGPCCFSVDHTIAGQFAKCFPESAPTIISHRNEHAHIDLAQSNAVQLQQAGCRGSNIELAGCCTRCTSDLFFSHRGEQGKTGRFALIAMLRS